MYKFLISCTLVSLLFIVPMVTFVVPSIKNLENERRQIAIFPEIPSKLRSGTIKKFFQGVDNFFLDHLPLRNFALKLSTALYEYSNDNMNMDKCYRGKENWLFLGNSYENCVEKLQGYISLSDGALKSLVAIYKKLRDGAQKCGAEFFIFIGPNKSSIYPEYLPSIVVPAPHRFISPLIDSLNKEGINVYDPTDLLINEKSKSSDIIYYRTDTHWNSLGAYKAFEGFRKYVNLPELPPLSFSHDKVYKGDLIDIGGYENFPLSIGDNFALHWSTPLSLNEENGGHLTTNTDAACEKTAWVFGDSFAGALWPYITAMFKEARLFRHNEFEKIILSQINKPDIIIWVQVERHFGDLIQLQRNKLDNMLVY